MPEPPDGFGAGRLAVAGLGEPGHASVGSRGDAEAPGPGAPGSTAAPAPGEEGGATAAAARRGGAVPVWARRAGFALLAAQLVGLAVLSTVLYRRDSLTYDYAAYHQAWYLIAHGHLDPYDSVLGFSFWRNNGEALLWLLALLRVVVHSGLVLLWVQDAAVVGAGAVAFAWACELTGRPWWDRRFRPGVAAALVLVVLVADPWTYWACAFDFHLEPVAALFVVLAARDLEGRRFRRAGLWVVLLLLTGDFAAGLVVGLGIAALVAGRPWRRAGVALVAAGACWVAVLAALGMRGGNLSAAYGYLVAAQPATAAGIGLPALAWGALLHPGRLVGALWARRLNIVAYVAPAGLVGVAAPWGLGVAVMVVLANNLITGLNFSTASFQYAPLTAVLAAATVLVLGRLARRWRRGPWAATALAVVLAADTLGWGAVWIPRTSSEWLRVSPAAATVLSSVERQVPAGDEVVASQGVLGRFSGRQWVYGVFEPGGAIPVRTRTVWVVVAPAQGIESEPVAAADALVTELAGPLHADLVAARAGVWAFRWTPAPSVTSLVVPPVPVTVPAWATPGPAGRPVTVGPPSTWRAVSTGHEGYVVAGDYRRLPPGRYTATVVLATTAPVDVEVWDATGDVLLARRQLVATNGQEAVTVPVDEPRTYPHHVYTGAGPFRITPVEPPPGDQLEVRVWTPGGAPVVVYSVELQPVGAPR